jgi:hypothetical protein
MGMETPVSKEGVIKLGKNQELEIACMAEYITADSKH